MAKIPEGLARYEDEIDREYIENFVEKSVEDDLLVVVEAEGRLEDDIPMGWMRRCIRDKVFSSRRALFLLV